MWVLVGLAVLCAAATTATAAEYGLDASLEAEIQGTGSTVVLHLKNRSNGPLCFFKFDRGVGFQSGDGKEIVTGANDLDTFGAKPSSVDVVWNDGVQYDYTLFTGWSSHTFDSLDDAKRTAQVDYTIAVYTCPELLRQPYGTAKPLFTEKVVATPIFVGAN